MVLYTGRPNHIVYNSMARASSDDNTLATHSKYPWLDCSVLNRSFMPFVLIRPLGLNMIW